MKKIKVTRKLLGILKAYTKLFGRIEGKYYKEIDRLEKLMQKETGIKDIEFYFFDGEMIAVGNKKRTMVIARERLEK